MHNFSPYWQGKREPLNRLIGNVIFCVLFDKTYTFLSGPSSIQEEREKPRPRRPGVARSLGQTARVRSEPGHPQPAPHLKPWPQPSPQLCRKTTQGTAVYIFKVLRKYLELLTFQDDRNRTLPPKIHIKDFLNNILYEKGKPTPEGWLS